MHLKNQVVATSAQIQALIKDYPKDSPIAMVNILKFKETADNGKESGQAAYQRYFKNMQPLLTKANARILWSGQVNMTVIGDTKEQPDMVAIVEYPSVQNFIDMATSADYQKVKEDRKIALTYGGLLASSSLITQ